MPRAAATPRHALPITTHAMPNHATQRHSAIESTRCRRNGSQTARSRVPRARQFSGTRVKSASVRFASRCGGA
eukprot:11177461-Lingulodinium_polyedra.AAC.1